MSEEEINQIIEAKKTDIVMDCGFEYKVSISNKKLEINCIEPCNKDACFYNTNLKEGVFKLVNGVYQRK